LKFIENKFLERNKFAKDRIKIFYISAINKEEIAQLIDDIIKNV
jgi:coenzyme F420-reducing hydrogenase delta subunit